MLILDTNVLSEILRPAPSSGVIDWLESQSRSQLFTTTITQAEILYGVALLPKGARRDRLAVATRAIFEEDFDEKVLPFDSRAADIYANIAAVRKSSGKPISQLDAMIAGITRGHQARLVTRNGRDFADCGIDFVDPWEG
jgi:predicted nucleic acid-binding protein